MIFVREYVPLRDALVPVVIQAQAMMERAAQVAAAHQQQKEEKPE
jgi:hypothetical protein